MDNIDRKILWHLQKNCRVSISDLGNLVGLSTSATHRRIGILEQEGVIEKYTAHLSGEKLGYSMIFYVEVSLENQSDKTLETFEKAALERPEVLECYLMTGSADYLVKVAAKNTKSYEQTYKRIIASLPHVSRIQSSLVMKTVKAWSGYSL